MPGVSERYGTNEKDERNFALHAEARETDPGVFGHLRAHCAAWGAEWFGDQQVKGLMALIDVVDAELEGANQ